MKSRTYCYLIFTLFLITMSCNKEKETLLDVEVYETSAEGNKLTN